MRIDDRYLIKVADYQPIQIYKKPKLKRPKPKIDIISIDTGSVFDEY